MNNHLDLRLSLKLKCLVQFIRKKIHFYFHSCSSVHACIHKGSFTNYIYKKRWVGSQKTSIFVNIHKVENVIAGVGGQRRPKKLSTYTANIYRMDIGNFIGNPLSA